MRVAMFYITLYRGIGFLVLVMIITGIISHIAGKRDDTIVHRLLSVLSQMCGIGALVIVIWLVAHHTYPDINDFKFLGKNIDAIEQQYGECDLQMNEDGSGTATFYTEDIVGHPVSNEYTCFVCEFNKK